MKFNQYLINEKITSKEFDEVLKNANILGGAEFEFYLEDAPMSSSIDEDQLNRMEMKSDREIDDMNKNISVEDIIATIQEWELQASSPYNDGWVIQSYKENIQKLREYLDHRKEPRLIT